MRYGTAKPNDARAKVAELLQAAVLRARTDDACSWVDGTQPSLAIADAARCHSYCRPEDYPSASSHALGCIYRLDRVPIAPHPTIIRDVAAIVGSVGPDVLERAYVAYLMATRAAHDGFGVMLSATGAEAVLLTSPRIPAAFDTLDDDAYFAMRRSLWGITDPMKRYSGLVGMTVTARAGEPPINAMQRFEFTIAREVADGEVAVGRALGVDVRHPFLDKRVSGYVATLHHSLRYGQSEKSLLKDDIGGNRTWL